MKKIVIFDLDGTITDHSHRVPLVATEGIKPDWDEFEKRCVYDVPNLAVVELYKYYVSLEDYMVLIMTGRSKDYQEKTIEWFESYKIPLPHLFIMRTKGDNTPDHELKKKWVQNIGTHRVVCTFEDRGRVVDMWRSLGLTCFQVAPGNF